MEHRKENQWIPDSVEMEEALRKALCAGHEGVRRLRLNWQVAACSDAGDHALKRYFSLFLRGISQIADTSCSFDQSLLISLIDHLWSFYEPFLDDRQSAPVYYRAHVLAQLQEPLMRVRDGLATAGLSPDFKAVLSAYLETLRPVDPPSAGPYQTLRYAVWWMEHMDDAVRRQPGEEGFIAQLLDLNFNDLGFLLFLQHRIREELPESKSLRLRYLVQKNQSLQFRLVRQGKGYYPDWPPLTHMLRKWLTEEIRELRPKTGNEESAPDIPAKLSLQLSVAQLALWVRLCYEGGFFQEENISELLRFFAAHCRSKKQAHISFRSLSKEYYSVDQVTAAVMRDKLQRMVSLINRLYFPA